MLSGQVQGNDPMLFQHSAPVLIVIHSQFSVLSAGFLLLNSRSGCLLSLASNISSILLYNVYELLTIISKDTNTYGYFDEEFWQKQTTWKCGLSFGLLQIAIALVLTVLMTK